jgi:recombinational DNA repair protein RecR
MSQSIVLLCPSSVSTETLRKSVVQLRTGVIHEGKDGFSIEKKDVDNSTKYIIISRLEIDNILATEYIDHEDLPSNLRNAEQASYFHIMYNNYDFAKEVILGIIKTFESDLTSIFVDNDHGDVISAELLVKNLSQDPSWDWRNP